MCDCNPINGYICPLHTPNGMNQDLIRACMGLLREQINISTPNSRELNELKQSLIAAVWLIDLRSQKQMEVVQ